jgi:hypothetical protein
LCIKLIDPYSAQSLTEVANDEPEAITVEEPRVSEARVAGNPGPSRQQPVHRTTTLHGTEIAYGLVTPGVTPAKAPGNHVRFHNTHSSRSTYSSVLS